MELSFDGLQPGKPVNVDACHNAPIEEVNAYICLKFKTKPDIEDYDGGTIAYRDLSGNLVPFIFFKIENIKKANALTYFLNQAYMMGLANSKGMYVKPSSELGNHMQDILKETNLL